MPSMSLVAIERPPRIAALMNPPRGGTYVRRRASRIGDGIRVLVGVRHAREEGELALALGLGPTQPHTLGDAVVGGAHEGVDALVIARRRGRPSPASMSWKRIACASPSPLGHVVHAEELVVSEQQLVHHLRDLLALTRASFTRVASRRAPSRARRSSSAVSWPVEVRDDVGQEPIPTPRWWWRGCSPRPGHRVEDTVGDRRAAKSFRPSGCSLATRWTK